MVPENENEVAEEKEQKNGLLPPEHDPELLQLFQAAEERRGSEEKEEEK